MRVLIVEDEPYLAEAVRDGLRLEAIAADIAGDGDTALELLSINSYDLAVLDRDIPGPSGDDVARSIVGPALASVQNQFSPGWRFSADELAHCAAHGLAFIPWSPFGGVSAAGSLASSSPAFAQVAEELDVSVYRVTLAWHLAQADVVIPIPGASRPESIVDSAAAAELELSDAQLAHLRSA